MTYEIYRYIFIGAAILCGAMIITSVLLFIFLKIPKVIGDLSGRTAKKAIEVIRAQNESSGDKTYKSSLVNQERGKVTDKISPSGRVANKTDDMLTGAMATQKIGTQRLTAEETTVLGGNETTVLGGGNETTVLGGANETTVLNSDNSYAAGAAAYYANETSVLSQNEFTGNPFMVEYEITYIHTDEVICAEVY